MVPPLERLERREEPKAQGGEFVGVDDYKHTEKTSSYRTAGEIRGTVQQVYRSWAGGVEVHHSISHRRHNQHRTDIHRYHRHKKPDRTWEGEGWQQHNTWTWKDRCNPHQTDIRQYHRHHKEQPLTVVGRIVPYPSSYNKSDRIGREDYKSRCCHKLPQNTDHQSHNTPLVGSLRDSHIYQYLGYTQRYPYK